ncbi:protein kinase family protein [Rhynchospora pubera]|uniref:non-specific serine/threonine protein kinase n=1 Tax=Rhynchospora pubera TaxID=906938 RepID=A0AAV8F7T2_9POAL|nr:protein kinase family protein [Rhynchospora pubera]
MQVFSLKRLLLFLSLLPFLFSLTSAQYQSLSPSQTKLLIRLYHILQSPQALSPLNTSTNFCYLPQSPNLTITCSNNQVTQLIVVGDRPFSSNWRNALSASFSIDAFFTTLVRLSSLEVLSLVSLGMWGPLPSKIDRLNSLRVLNLSSNHIYGEIPKEISTVTSLQNLVLSNNYMNGTVPNLKPLTGLTELDLGFNRLGPDFPSLSNSIVKLILKNNSLTKLPQNLAKSLSMVEKLDLSFNKLSGWVPSSLFSLPSIQYLDLSHNKLTGQLPETLTCSNSISFVDISNNMLSGTLPSCIVSNSSNRVVDFSWNCLNLVDMRYQHPNSYCNEGALAAVLPPPNDITTSKKSSTSLIVGIVCGVLGFVAIIALVIGIVLKKAKKQGQFEDGRVFKPKEGKSFPPKSSRTPVEKRHATQAARLGAMEVTPYRIFTIEELEEATNYFDHSNLIKSSAQGQLYKGWLQDGTTVVVRCLKLKQKYLSQNLAQYMDIISKLRHRHLISIIGHCISDDQDSINTPTMVYLVTEYVCNGTLRSHLTEWRKREMLKWPQRVTAVIGVARGVQFLHNVSVPGITGNDIDADNVFLDHTLTAKIGNFNLPKLPSNKNHKGASESSISLFEENIHGSIRNIEQGQKEDIYQLGLILLEVLTGKPAQSKTQLDSVKSLLQKGLNEGQEKLKGIVDPTICGTFAMDSLRTVVELTLNCLAENARDRPSIDDVLWNLQYSVQVQEGWASSGNLSIQL